MRSTQNSAILLQLAAAAAAILIFQNNVAESSSSDLVRQPRQTGVLREIVGRKYFIDYFGTKLPISEAAGVCHQKGMHLVSFETEAEYKTIDDFLFNHYMYGKHFWTSGRRVAGTWQWSVDGAGSEPVTFSYMLWNKEYSQPDELEEDVCMSFVSSVKNVKGGWYDNLCNATYNVLCEQRG